MKKSDVIYIWLVRFAPRKYAFGFNLAAKKSHKTHVKPVIKIIQTQNHKSIKQIMDIWGGVARQTPRD